jgi:hypothetical protein
MTLLEQGLIAGGLAGLVGLAEIVSRYRSDPGFALRRPEAWLYIIVNTASGVAALFIIRAFGWTFGQTSDIDLWRALVAGFGALAVFRSALFVTKVGESNVNVGPSQVLTSLLDTFDRAIDRQCASELSDELKKNNLDNLEPKRVIEALPLLCLALMQNFSTADQALLGTALEKIRTEDKLKDPERMQATISQLAKFLGYDLVQKVLTASTPLFTKEQEKVTVVAEARVKKGIPTSAA